MLSKKARQRLKWFDYYKSHNQNARLTCRYFGISPQTFYRWKRRYDPRHTESLEDHSHRPRHVRQPSYSVKLAEAVLRLREEYPRWGKDKLVILLRREGFASSASTVGRILKKLKERGVLKEPLPNHISARKSQRQRPYAIRKPKDYVVKEPGDIVEVDTLDVRPLAGVVLKHFTARDVISKWDVLEAHTRASSHTAAAFMDTLIRRMPFPIKVIQVDGGSEFQDRFEEKCQRRGIKPFVLPPRSPKLNGHVERAQRTHTEEFYEVTGTSFEIAELNQALLEWERVYNAVRPHQALRYLTPKKFLKLHQQNTKKGGGVTNHMNEYICLTWFPFNQYNRFEEVNVSGIVSCGAYVPLWRLNLAAIASGLKGEKSVCNFDEDSVTMAAAAAIDCLKGVDRGAVDGLVFASTTSPYKEKQAAGIVAAATDLRHNILTADFANSLKAGTTALKLALDSAKAGSAKQIMIAAADRRQGTPMSTFDQSCGDGAAALLVGNLDVIASLEASYSTSDEIMDVWRADGDTFLRTVHPRFVEVEGYERVIKETISGLMKENNLVPKDFAKIALYAPNARRATEVARSLGFDAKTQLQDGFFNLMGNTGVPYALMLFIAALEEAKPGDLILLASYGDGSDAFAFRVTDQIKRMQENSSRRGMKKHLETKRMIPDYKTYWLWRGLLNPGLEPYITHHFDQVAPTILWRDRNQILRLYAVKCKACGTVQYPAQRVCSKCHAKDQFEEVRLSDKKGTILTFSMDYVDSEIDTPIVVPIVNFDGGGQIVCYMTDRVVEEVKAGMEVEMSFRKIFYRESMGLHNYFWKAVPIRA